MLDDDLIRLPNAHAHPPLPQRHYSPRAEYIKTPAKYLCIFKTFGYELPLQIMANFCDFRALWSHIYCMTIAIYMYTIFPGALMVLPSVPSHNLDLVNSFVFRSADIVSHR